MNTSGQNSNQDPIQSGIKVQGGSSPNKESEPLTDASGENVSEISKEVEIPKEVEKAGVKKIQEIIELPPDVKKLGVTQTVVPIGVQKTPSLPKVILPISDTQVIAGLHTNDITNSLKWVALWCIKKLQKAHIMLKVIHGKIMRVKD